MHADEVGALAGRDLAPISEPDRLGGSFGDGAHRRRKIDVGRGGRKPERSQ